MAHRLAQYICRWRLDWFSEAISKPLELGICWLVMFSFKWAPAGLKIVQWDQTLSGTYLGDFWSDCHGLKTIWKFRVPRYNLQKASWVPNRVWDPRYVSQQCVDWSRLKYVKATWKPLNSKCNLASSFPLWTSGGLNIPLTSQNSGLGSFLNNVPSFYESCS